jgi:hypothetical protein
MRSHAAPSSESMHDDKSSDDRPPLPPVPPASSTGRIRTALLLVLLVFLSGFTEEEAASFSGHLHNRGVDAGDVPSSLLHDSPKTPCLFIFIGESFRTGGQKSRVRGLNSSLPAQRAAMESHLSLHRRLAQADGHVCDVIVLSCTTPFDKRVHDGERGHGPARPYPPRCRFSKGLEPSLLYL